MLADKLRAAALSEVFPSYVSSSSASNATLVTSITVTTPSGAQSGDYLLACISCGSREVTTPSGWTLLTSVDDGTGDVYVFGQLLSSSPAADYSFSLSGTTRPIALMLCFRDADFVVASSQDNASSLNVVAPSVSATSNNSILVCFFCREGDSNITSPAAMTERIEENLSLYRSAMAATQVVNSGSTGTRTATVSSGSAVSVGASIILG